MGGRLKRFGTTRSLRRFEPAIAYAERGFPVRRGLSLDIADELRKVAADSSLRENLPGEWRSAEAGDHLVQATWPGRCGQSPLVERTRCLADRSPSKSLAVHGSARAGWYRRPTCRRTSRQWQEPISTTYAGQAVLAFPPNSQGMTFLEMLNIAE